MKNDCPYRTGDGKCVHISIASRRKDKPRCIYSDPSKCDAYQEWVELVNTKDFKESLNVEPLKSKFEVSED